MQAQLSAAAESITGRTCVVCDDRPGLPMLIKQQWDGDRYVIPVCDNITCRARGKMNWDGALWDALDEDIAVFITAEPNTTGAKLSTEATEELFWMLSYND